jgi:hypothetical protein
MTFRMVINVKANKSNMKIKKSSNDFSVMQTNCVDQTQIHVSCYSPTILINLINPPYLFVGKTFFS